MYRLIKSIAFVFAFFGVGAFQAHAVPIVINSFDGTGTAFTGNNGGAGSTSITFSGAPNNIAFINGPNFPSPSLTASFGTVMTVNNTPVVSGTDLTYTVTSGAFAFTITDGTFTNTFTVTPTTLVTSSGPPALANVATINAILQLTSSNNIPAYDFSPFASAVDPNFVFSINTSSSGGFPGLFSGSSPAANNVIAGTGSFSANAIGFAAVPEPTSMVLLGGMMLGCGAVWARKRRKEQVVA